MSKWVPNRLTDFSGGYVDKVDDTELPAGALKTCWNMISRQVGKISKRNGQVKLNTTELGSPGTGVHYPVQGIHTYYKGTTKYLLVVANGVVYACTPPATTMTAIKTGLDTTAPVNFVNAMIDGVNSVMGFNGVNQPFKWDGVMQAQVETATVVGTVNSPVSQVETAVVVGTITGEGNASVTVTAAGMTGSPKTISVAVALSDDASAVAGKIRTALNADSAVTALFTVGGTGANVTLTKTVPTANDATLNIAYANDTCTGLTADATSDNTTAGVASGAGNLSVIVTAAGMTGSPVTLSIAVTAGDSASTVAGKIKTAMGNNAGIAAWFTIGGTGADVVLTCKAIAINDSTLNVAISPGTSAGITEDLTSTNATAGITVTDMQDYRIVTREEPTTTDYTVYTLANKPVRSGSDKLFVFANSDLVDSADYTLDATNGTIAFDAARTNTVSDLDSDDAQTVCFPLTGLVQAAHPFKPGCTVTLYDKDDVSRHVFTNETADGDWRADYAAGYIYTPTEIPIAATGGTLTANSTHKVYTADYPFSTDAVPVIKDKDSNVLTPSSIDYTKGTATFTASKESVEPLTVDCTFLRELSTLMPFTVSYEWVDSIKVDYQYSNGDLSYLFRYPVAHQGRVFVMAGDEHIYWSDINENGSDYESWPPVNNWPVKQGSGEDDGCLVSMAGDIYVFKSRSIHRFRGSDLDDYTLKEIEPDIGCAGPRAACLDGSRIYFVSEQGLYVFNGAQAQNISRDRIPLLWDRVNKSVLSLAVVKAWHGLILFALPLDTSTTNNIVLAYDAASGAFWPWDSMSISCYAEISTTSGVKLYAGHAAQGYVLEQDSGTDDYGTNITAYFDLPTFDVGAADTLKKSRYIFIEYGEDQATWGTISASKDNAAFASLTAKNAEEKLRKYALKPTITGKYRYLCIRVLHDTADGFEIRSVNTPFKIKSKPTVKGVVS